MFGIEPYNAERQVFTSNADGGMSSTWQPCRVIGVANDENGDPAYIVETISGRDRMLAVEPYVRRVA